jgi:hypothetical protein
VGRSREITYAIHFTTLISKRSNRYASGRQKSIVRTKCEAPSAVRFRLGTVTEMTSAVPVWTISPFVRPNLMQEATDEAEEALRQAVEQLDVMPLCRDFSGTRPARLSHLVVRDGAP